MEEGHVTGSEAGWSVVSGLGDLQVDSGGLPPMTGALQAAPRHSLFFVKGIGPVVLGMVRTAQAGADVLHGEADEQERGVGVEGEGRSDRWTAVMGMGRALVNVALNKSVGQEGGHCRQDSAAH